MGFLALVQKIAPVAQKIAGDLLVTATVIYGASRPYDPAVGTVSTTGGSTVTTQALRYSEKATQTTGFRQHGHPTDGIVAVTEKILFWTNDFPAATLLKKWDVVKIPGLDGSTNETWQIKDVEPDPTRSVVICTIERS